MLSASPFAMTRVYETQIKYTPMHTAVPMTTAINPVISRFCRKKISVSPVNETSTMTAAEMSMMFDQAPPVSRPLCRSLMIATKPRRDSVMS